MSDASDSYDAGDSYDAMGDRVRDADDIVIERRLRAIFDIREEIHDLRKKFRLGQLEGFSEFDVLTGYRTLIDSYLTEIQPLLLKFDSGEKLLNEVDLGFAYVVPAYVERNTGAHSTSYKLHRHGEEPLSIKGKPQPEKKKFKLEGLRSLWRLPDPLEATFEVPIMNPDTMSTLPERITVTDQMGFQTLDRILRKMNVFLSEIGFELEPEPQGDNETRIDYSDLI